jgi:hypothetical protein
VAAAEACLAEAADANFASTHGKSFQQFYGTNADLSNAFGNCVLKKLQASTAKLTQALVKASKTCKALRRPIRHVPPEVRLAAERVRQVCFGAGQTEVTREFDRGPSRSRRPLIPLVRSRTVGALAGPEP